MVMVPVRQKKLAQLAYHMYCVYLRRWYECKIQVPQHWNSTCRRCLQICTLSNDDHSSVFNETRRTRGMAWRRCPKFFKFFDVVYNLSHTIDRSLVESRVVVEFVGRNFDVNNISFPNALVFTSIKIYTPGTSLYVIFWSFVVVTRFSYIVGFRGIWKI